MNDIDLRIERMEREVLSEFHQAVPAEASDALGPGAETIGGAWVSSASGDPSILLNRTLGLGVESPAGRDTVFGIRDHYAARGIGRYFLHAQCDADAALRGLLEEAGLTAARGWMKFARGREAPPEASTDLRIEEIGPEHGDSFGRIVARGFDLTDAAVPGLAGLIGRPGWHIFISFDGDTPAGCGALYVKDGTGWCDWGATSPDFRRRGGQRAVLAARVRAALDLGCDVIATETGEAVEGDPQHSYHNILWAGFREAGLRDNYVPRNG